MTPPTSESPYWSPCHNTLARPELEALQIGKLRRLVALARERSRFHAERLAGVEPESIRGLGDLARIPFTTRDEWMAAQLAEPPYGTLPAASEEVEIRYHRTSGTTGRTPIRVLDSTRDWEWIAEMWCHGFWGFGVRPRDRVFMAFGYATFIGFWGAHRACEKLGCLVLPGAR